MLTEVQYRGLGRYRELAMVLLLTLLAFAVRVYRVDFNSLSEDESAKWAAIQEYRNGHFAGVNSEHPMLPKVLAWASLATGERWSRVAAVHGWPSLKPEGWLRMPNVLFGAAAAAVLFLLCRRMMGLVGSFAASFFWAVAPLPVALIGSRRRKRRSRFSPCWPVTSIAAPNRQMRARVRGDGTT